MRNARSALLGSFVVLGFVGAASCGGDDSSGKNTTSTAGSAGAGGATTGSAGSGGSSTGSGGSGGATSDAGAACPPTQPLANTACDLDYDCAYGLVICSCVASLWTCNGPPPEGGAGCPMADPEPGESCTTQGLVCHYGGGLDCTCDTQTGWMCVQSAR